MGRAFTGTATSDLARGQLRVFSEIGDAIRLSAEERRRVLSLSETEWAAWAAFQRDGALPVRPRLSEMLLRLGSATYELAMAAERQGVPA